MAGTQLCPHRAQGSTGWGGRGCRFGAQLERLPQHGSSRSQRRTATPAQGAGDDDPGAPQACEAVPAAEAESLAGRGGALTCSRSRPVAFSLGTTFTSDVVAGYMG